jgi:predicted nuclease of restriction endonuclease-like (RecB) superfamily
MSNSLATRTARLDCSANRPGSTCGALAGEYHLLASIEHGWSRNVLTHHISTQLREREGKALTNFCRTLPVEDSDLMQQTLKDPYSFEF